MNTNVDFIKGYSNKKYFNIKEENSRFINLHSDELKFIVPWAQYDESNRKLGNDNKAKLIEIFYNDYSKTNNEN
jgi:predicted oxidoreductase (fatty acid repression mutant protein)